VRLVFQGKAIERGASPRSCSMTESEQLSRELELRDAKIINLSELLRMRDTAKKRGGYTTHPEQMLMLDVEFALSALGLVKIERGTWVNR
jgi:hypothetical protein